MKDDEIIKLWTKNVKIHTPEINSLLQGDIKILEYTEETLLKAIDLVKNRCTLLTDFKKELSWLFDPFTKSMVVIKKVDGTRYILGVRY